MLSAITKSLTPSTALSKETNPFDPGASTPLELGPFMHNLDSYISRIQQKKINLTPCEVRGAVFCALLLLQPQQGFLGQSPGVLDHKRALQQAASKLEPACFVENISTIRTTLIQLSRLDLRCTTWSFAHAVRIILRLEEERAYDITETETLQLSSMDSDSIKNVRIALTSIIKDGFPESSELHICAQGYHEALISNKEDSHTEDLIPHYHTKLEELFALSRFDRLKGGLSDAKAYLGSWSPFNG